MYHLSRLSKTPPSEIPAIDQFLNGQLLAILNKSWFADIMNCLVKKETPSHWSKQNKYQFFSQIKYFYWDNPYLFKYCPDQIF